MSGYRVISTDLRERFGPDAKPRQVYVVWIETDSGTTGSLEVDQSKWNEDDLPGILEEFAGRLDLALRLAG